MRSSLVMACALVVLSGCPQPERTVCPDVVEQQERPVSDDLEPFLTSYFSTWSEGDMRGYGDHFLPSAVVTFVAGGRVRTTIPLEPFLEQQGRMQQNPTVRSVERMVSFRADEDEQAAVATVSWHLEGPRGDQQGIDRFTLIRDEGGQWKIASLLFYTTER